MTNSAEMLHALEKPVCSFIEAALSVLWKKYGRKSATAFKGEIEIWAVEDTPANAFILSRKGCNKVDQVKWGHDTCAEVAFVPPILEEFVQACLSGKHIIWILDYELEANGQNRGWNGEHIALAIRLIEDHFKFNHSHIVANSAQETNNQKINEAAQSNKESSTDRQNKLAGLRLAQIYRRKHVSELGLNVSGLSSPGAGSISTCSSPQALDSDVSSPIASEGMGSSPGGAFVSGTGHLHRSSARSLRFSSVLAAPEVDLLSSGRPGFGQ